MSDVAPGVPLDRQIACAERELAMRQRVYPRWVAAGKMTQVKADEEVACMSAVLATVQSVAALEAELARLRPSERSTTHWATCYLARHHHECAITKIEELERQTARYGGLLGLYQQAGLRLNDLLPSEILARLESLESSDALALLNELQEIPSPDR